MSLTEKTRQILWIRSGSRCALCRQDVKLQELAPADQIAPDPAIAVEHPILLAPETKPPLAPRWEGYDNLILLCNKHHQQIQENPDTFPSEQLYQLKTQHEQWVRQTLAESMEPTSPPITSYGGVSLMPRIQTGRKLTQTLHGAHFFSFEHDELETEEDSLLVEQVTQQLRDWGNHLNQVEDGNVLHPDFTLTADLQALTNQGFLFFGEQQHRVLHLCGAAGNWAIAKIWMTREIHPPHRIPSDCPA